MPGFYDPALNDNNGGEYALNTVLPYQVGPGVNSLRSVVDNEEKPSNQGILFIAQYGQIQFQF